MTRTSPALIVVLGLSVSLTALAQQPAASSQTPAEASTAAPASPPAAGVAAVSADGVAPAAARRAQAASAAPAAATPTEAAKTDHAAAQAPATAVQAATASKRSSAAAASTDRLELGTTEISGNRELPKVLYVVPWRRPEPGDAVGRPPNSLVEEALTPVDRDVFQRQNRYFSTLESSAASAKSQPGPAGTAHP